MTSYGAGEERFIFSDSTAIDKKTGLVWVRDANIVNKALTWNEAHRFIEQLNGKNMVATVIGDCLQKDELQTLIDYAKSQGYMSDFSDVFNKIGFKNLQVFYYWSSTSNPYDSADAFGITMFNGSATYSGDKNLLATMYGLCGVGNRLFGDLIISVRQPSRVGKTHPTLL